MEVHKYINKFKLLFELVFEGKLVLNEVQTEQLLKFLKDPGDNSSGKLILETPYFSDLLFKSLENFNNVSTTAQVFLIEIGTLLFKNELQFTKMQMQGFHAMLHSHLSAVCKGRSGPPPTSLHLACLKAATMKITHRSGLKIIVEKKAWKSILPADIHHKPKKISEAAYNFMAKLVWRLHEYGSEQELLEVLEYIIEPIHSSGYFQVSDINTETDMELSDKIITFLNTLAAVLSEAEKYSPVNRVMYLFKQHFIIPPRLFKIYCATRNLQLSKLLNCCLFRLSFGIMRRYLVSNQTDEFCNKMAAFHRNILGHAMNKREAYAVIDIVIQSNIIWSNFEKAHAAELDLPLTFVRNGQKVEFSLQLIIHLIVPLVYHASELRCCHQPEWTEVVETFIIKIGRTITDYIYTSCYAFGKIVQEGGVSFRKSVAIHAMKEIHRLKGHLSEAQAGIVFQGLYYSLETFIERDGIGELIVNENTMDQESLRLLSHLLDTMKMLLKDHHIPWYENVEIIGVQAALLNLLKQNFLLIKHVVQVLDLLNICVSKFLSPNMSLLLENKSTKDDTLTEIGKVIKLYTPHEDWEVRDSALSLLNTCTEISFIKYIPLQKVIKENDLMRLATKAALSDPEFYPQCVALNCLSAATKIDDIWQEILVDNEHIYVQLVYILKNHSEGMVRKEAVNVLTGVYSNQKVSPNFQNTLYDVMLTAALDDLHWEVQLSALNFWKKAIHNQLTYRGMLDGKFPSVTFSKEKRKIIVLNNEEIQKQLTSILYQLASIGCLTVLLECMKEINNIEVIDKAYSMTKIITDLLDTYNFDKLIRTVKVEPMLELPKYNIERDSKIFTNLTNTSEEDRDIVINSVLSEYQSELIFNLHDNCEINNEKMDVDFVYSRQELISAEVFLDRFRNNDYTLIIEDKRKSYNDYANTLDGVLDEILNV